MAKMLSTEQRYLLARIPSQYTIHHEPLAEPEAVRKARKLCKAWDEKKIRRDKAHYARIGKLINEAREAVYFQPAAAALKLIKKLEAMKDGGKGE